MGLTPRLLIPIIGVGIRIHPYRAAVRRPPPSDRRPYRSAVLQGRASKERNGYHP